MAVKNDLVFFFQVYDEAIEIVHGLAFAWDNIHEVLFVRILQLLERSESFRHNWLGTATQGSTHWVTWKPRVTSGDRIYKSTQQTISMWWQWTAGAVTDRSKGGRSRLCGSMTARASQRATFRPLQNKSTNCWVRSASLGDPWMSLGDLPQQTNQSFCETHAIDTHNLVKRWATYCCVLKSLLSCV